MTPRANLNNYSNSCKGIQLYSLRKESLSPREQLCLELDFGLGGGGGGGGGTQLNAFGQKMCLGARGNKELGGQLLHYVLV